MSVDINKLQDSLLNISNLLVEAEKQVQESINSLPAEQRAKAKTYFEDVKKKSQSADFDIKKEKEKIKKNFK